jgi:pimeloyl-ACP methyl ester carboxylesterase
VEPLFEHRLEFAGYETRALELEGDGPPLVLLHGFADSADTWRRALDLLARRGQRALALDMPGFGQAGRLRDDAPILEQLGQFAAAAVEHVGPGAVVAGNSLGGVVALRAAQEDGLELAGVVPVAPAGLDMPRWFAIIERDPIVRTLLAAPIPLPEIVVRALIGQAYRTLAFARPRALPPGVVASFTGHHRDRETLARYLATGRRMLPELQDCFELGRIRCPVLLIWGDRDRLVTHRGSERLLAALPDTEYVLLRGCGHCPQVEEPARFVEVLLGFVGAGEGRAVA